MNRLLFSLFILVAVVFNSCENDESLIFGSDPLLGYWIEPAIGDSITIFRKSGNFKEDEYGICFQPDGLFLERQNSSWCGTPPIVYVNNQGTWAKTDSVLTIHVRFWGGTAQYQWKVLSVTNATLTIKRLSETFPLDN